MGNQQSAVPRERNKSGSQDLIPGSPIRGKIDQLRRFFLKIHISIKFLETQFFFRNTNIYFDFILIDFN